MTLYKNRYSGLSDKSAWALTVFLGTIAVCNYIDAIYFVFVLYTCGVVHDWFESYLPDRQQFTAVASADSGLAKITCGVPQGSVLGPLVFLLYVNDIANAVLYSHNTELCAEPL